MFDQESVVLPVEVDILEKLLLAHLLSLLIKIGFKMCDSPHICMSSPVPPAEKKLSSETSEENKKPGQLKRGDRQVGVLAKSRQASHADM